MMQICWYSALERARLPKVSFGGEAMPFALQIAPEVDVRELGPLPIVMHYLRRMEVKKLIDAKIPPHALQPVTHGECIEALLCAIFLGTHTLSHVAKTLSNFDLPHLFEHPGLSSEQFNDTKLGEALDALYGKTESLYADVVIRGLHAFDLVIRRIHTDSTTLKLFGAYDFADEIEASHLTPPPRPKPNIFVTSRKLPPSNMLRAHIYFINFQRFKIDRHLQFLFADGRFP